MESLAEAYQRLFIKKKPYFDKLSLRQPTDFLLHLPLRYEDRTHTVAVAALKLGQAAQCVVRVDSVQHGHWQHQAGMLVRSHDETRTLWLRFFHRQAYHIMKPGTRIRVYGVLRESALGVEMSHPTCSLASTPLPSTLTPVYPTTAGLSQQVLRTIIDQVLAQTNCPELLPQAICQRYRLPTLRDSILFLHHPPATEVQHCQALCDRTHPMWRRIQFEELLAQQLALRQRVRQHPQQTRQALIAQQPLVETFVEHLPFCLTSAQQHVWQEVVADLTQPLPMHRLLQGDVGSGKTVIAAMALLHTIAAGYQAALMVPTELLALQQYERLCTWFAPLNVNVMALIPALHTATQKKDVLRRLAEGEIAAIVGTHALLQPYVSFQQLALIIIDEQHRFGVKQRLLLKKKGQHVHQLMMSATPIPRTLCMTHYAHVAISTLDELPQGRRAIQTVLIDQKNRKTLIERLGPLCQAGQQVYWVCPLIEESAKLDLQTALVTHQELTAALPMLGIDFIHGRMKTAEKNDTMQRFARREIHILVATTVVEVGIDQPNASIMIIEHAERFGLAQLHQLRGRVGRGSRPSTCVLLFYPPLSPAATSRLKTIQTCQDGFTIAEQDLRLRGPGHFLGEQQSGAPLLRFFSIALAQPLLSEITATAALVEKDHAHTIMPLVQFWLPQQLDFVHA